MRFVLFPWGRVYHYPDDKLNAELAERLSRFPKFRDKLTSDIYLSTDRNTNIGRLDDAMVKVLLAESAEKKLKNLIRKYSIKGSDYKEKIYRALELGLITEEEAFIIRQADLVRQAIIQVDDFDQELKEFNA